MNIFARFSIAGKKALITGAASGIGKCASLTFAECGAHLIIVDKNGDGLRDLAEEVNRDYGVRVLPICVDIADQRQVDDMIVQIDQTFGELHISLNNAGIAIHEEIPNLSISTLDKVLDVNLRGCFLTAQASAKYMLERNISGTIINTASICSHIINRPQKSAAYCISKGGVLQMTKAMAAELAPHNIRVNAISPGYVMTNIVKDSPNIEFWKSQIPMNRLASVDEIMGAILYLASDASTYTTGTDIVIDGGYTCW